MRAELRKIVGDGHETLGLVHDDLGREVGRAFASQAAMNWSVAAVVAKNGR
jgi:hypothetical protein